MATVNATFASPSADAKYAQFFVSQSSSGIIAKIVGGLNFWSIVLSLFLLLVVYDQGKFISLHLLCAFSCS